MKAFLLAAGIGSRLRPITDTVPKCMVTIDDRPLLDIWLDALRPGGGGRGSRQPAPPPRRRAPPRRGADRPARGSPRLRAELLGSAGTLLANRRWVAGEDFFLACNADNLTDFDLPELIDVHRTGDAVATLTAYHSENPSAGGVPR